MSAKVTLTALAAALLLASAVSTASAARLSTSSQNIRATFTSLEFAAPGVVTIRCQVTLEGSFHTRTIAKVARSLIGAITRVVVKEEACTNGRARALPPFPYHLTFEGFAGALPNITSVNLLLSRFLFNIEVEGLCNGDYGNATDNVAGRANREAGGNITELIPSGTAHLLRRNSGIFCPAEGNFSGRGSVMQLGTTTPIRVTLI